MIRHLKPIGTYSEKQARKYFKRGLLFLIPFVFLWLTSMRFLPCFIDMGIFEVNRGFLMGMFVAFGIVYTLLPYKTYKSGLTGERAVVYNISDKLGSNYSLFNDILLKDRKRSGNIDHIIVGPTGIFVIETKNNKGTVAYDGYHWKGVRGNPSQQAMSNTFRIKDVLKNCEVFKEKALYVNAVVLFTNSKINLKISKKPEWCKVLQIENLADSRLSDYIRNEPIRFSEKEIMLIEQNLKNRIGNYDE